jgi:hypothetical protein
MAWTPALAWTNQLWHGRIVHAKAGPRYWHVPHQVLARTTVHAKAEISFGMDDFVHAKADTVWHLLKPDSDSSTFAIQGIYRKNAA